MDVVSFEEETLRLTNLRECTIVTRVAGSQYFSLLQTTTKNKHSRFKTIISMEWHIDGNFQKVFFFCMSGAS